tara:strand:+ start:583 stop:1296 length:714 start_codon:yes stop_codon:yes gene_type:complete
MEKHPASAVIYQGKSLIDKQDIVVIISGLDGNSQNRKTGHMAQVDIILTDPKPTDAVKSGSDFGICGNCTLRPIYKNAASCYVNKGWSPLTKWKCFQAGKYPRMTPTQANTILKDNGISVRIGAYGEPSAVPFKVWQQLVDGTKFTAYTHSFNEHWYDKRLDSICMLSLDTKLNTVNASSKRQFRTYKIIGSKNELKPNEIMCPADMSKADGIQCKTCLLCCGSSQLKAKNIAIIKI